MSQEKNPLIEKMTAFTASFFSASLFVSAGAFLVAFAVYVCHLAGINQDVFLVPFLFFCLSVWLFTRLSTVENRMTKNIAGIVIRLTGGLKK